MSPFCDPNQHMLTEGMVLSQRFMSTPIGRTQHVWRAHLLRNAARLEILRVASICKTPVHSVPVLAFSCQEKCNHKKDIASESDQLQNPRGDCRSSNLATHMSKSMCKNRCKTTYKTTRNTHCKSVCNVQCKRIGKSMCEAMCNKVST